MKDYEVMMIIDPRITDEKVEQVIAKVGKRLEGSGGQVEKVNKMGKRPLVFTLKKYKRISEGNYVLLNFKGEAGTPADLNNFLRISDDVLRYTINVATTNPAAAMEAEKATEVSVDGKEEVEINPSLLNPPKEN